VTLLALLGAVDVFADIEEVEDFFTKGSWRIRISEHGDVVVVDRWRRHLSFLAVRGVWCPERRVESLVRGVLDLALFSGLDRVVSPLLSEERLEVWKAAGLRPKEHVVTYVWRRSWGDAGRVSVPGVRLERARPQDLQAILDIDHASFESFWALDEPMLERHLCHGRCVLAKAGDDVIGYCEGEIHGVQATIGRLAVAPGWRGRGIGRLLIEDERAVFCEKPGVSWVTLCTQEDNGVSRRLYERCGFRPQPGRMTFLISDKLGVPGDEGKNR